MAAKQGRNLGFDKTRDRMLLSDIRRRVIEDSGVFGSADMIPLPCNPETISIGYGLRNGRTVLPLTSLVPREELDACLGQLVDALLHGGPLAQKAAKDLIAAVDGENIDEIISEETARRIARQRATAEAKDGIAAFLDKRPPGWL